MYCSLPGSFIHGILQTRILEWVAIPFSKVSSQPSNQTQVLCIAGRFFTVWATREAWIAIQFPKENSELDNTEVRSLWGHRWGKRTLDCPLLYASPNYYPHQSTWKSNEFTKNDFFYCLLCCDGFKFALQILDLILNKKIEVKYPQKISILKKKKKLHHFVYSTMIC